MTIQLIISVIFLLLVLCGSFCISDAASGRHSEVISSNALPIATFVTALSLGLILRLILGYNTTGFSLDISCFKAWAMYTHEVGFNSMYYSDFFIDYPPGYLYMLYLMEFFRRLFFIPDYSQTFILLIKLIPILSDIGCTAIIWVLARKKLSESASLFTVCAYLFCPAVILNSAVWGQADSFCALLLLLTLLLLWYDHIPAAAVMYGMGILSKPQMLIFAPVLIFWVIRKRKFRHLVIGPVLCIAVILLLATPFIRDFDYLKLIDLYIGTMDQYAYYTLNAYNLWAMLGLNWASLPEHGALLQFGVPIATALAGILVLGSKKDEAIFACPTVLMFTVYMLCTKMHERYLFLVLLCMLLTYIATREKRYLLCFAGTSFFHFLNVAYVLYLNNAYIEPTAPQIILLSAAHLIMYLYMLYITWSTFLSKKGKMKPLHVPQIKPDFTGFDTEVSESHDTSDIGRRITRLDLILMASVTLVYAAVAFTNLGDTKTANTVWTPTQGESAIFSTDEYYSEIFYLPGIAAADNGMGQRTGTSMRVEVSDDGKSWLTAAEITEGSVYAWNNVPVMETGRYIRITPTCDDLAVNEFALKSITGNGFVALTQISVTGDQLIDEQDTVPLFPSYMNSTYFDEIYHARTAYEYILGLEPYENTHPTLGKLIIALGILIFGMNPFGWRFMGTLFGVLMLPILYHLLKRLFGSSAVSFAGSFIFAFDFMHYVQTRIATIDTYAVFFMLLMYDAMVVFLQTDLLRCKLRRALLPLLLSGLFMGLGIASKWTVAYAACGFAVLFFGKLVVSYRGIHSVNQPEKERTQDEYLKKCLKLCLWCCLFFIAIPFAIYFAAFLPITTLPHNRYDVFGRFVAYQTHMYNYHSNLQATHTFQSAWYQWPLDIRNVWYYGNYNADGMSGLRTISVLGSPLFWWISVPAVLYSIYGAASHRKMPAIVSAIGFLSVMIPWIPVSRCTFIYHYFTAVPFLVIAMIYTWQRLCRRSVFQRRLISFNIRGRATSISAAHLTAAIFLALHIILFVIFYPVLTGTLTTREYADALEWLPTWHFA